jgi:protein-S-isoprenylcysteine O-methyltransferase Ste14
MPSPASASPAPDTAPRAATSAASRLPSLGPRGEGWVAIQVVLFGVIALANVTEPGDASTAAVTVGSAVLLAGLATMGAGLLWLQRGRALTAVPHPLASASLVDGGPYRFVRHPIYAGIVLGALGWAIAAWSGWGVAAALLLLAFFDLKRRREEAWLVAGIAGYDAYRGRVRALVPFLY